MKFSFYGGLFCVFLCITSLGQNQIPNFDFEKPERGSACGFQNWHTEDHLDKCLADSVNVYKGKYSIYISRNKPGGIGRFCQEMPFKCSELKKFRISCFIKTRNLKEKYTGLSVKLYDKTGNMICHQNMADLNINKTRSWKKYFIEFCADSTAEKVKISGLIYDSGEAWYDNIELVEIPFSTKKISPSINRYINEYFNIVREKSLNRDSVYLNRLKADAKKLCAGNSKMSYCHAVLKGYVTWKLNDGHSFFKTSKEMKELAKGDNTLKDGLSAFAEGKMLDGRIAYIKISTFISLDSLLVNKYADSLQRLVAELDGGSPKGWIIDLSNNIGGNSWAMIAGIGPLLGNGIFGYSVSANGTRTARIYRDGIAGWDNRVMVKKKDPFYIKNKDLPIAVIYGSETGSAGEVVAIAFRGIKNASSFGMKTFGVTTRVDNIRLSDGAFLNLACGVDADRNNVSFGGKISPDYPNDDYKSALNEAQKWILENNNN
ncbi:MAG: S41 family peptidase [Bacteroidia bacterium]|nr:S41 family peptidase [Bacteroidia bacterium]